MINRSGTAADSQSAAVVIPLSSVPSVPAPVPSVPEYRANESVGNTPLPAVPEQSFSSSPVIIPVAMFDDNVVPASTSVAYTSTTVNAAAPSSAAPVYSHEVKGKFHAAVHAQLAKLVPEVFVPVIEYGAITGLGVWLGGMVFKKFFRTWSASKIK